MNFGRTSSDMRIEDDVISESYHNGDNVCTNKSLEARTRVEYRCSKDTKVRLTTM